MARDEVGLFGFSCRLSRAPVLSRSSDALRYFSAYSSLSLVDFASTASVIRQTIRRPSRSAVIAPSLSKISRFSMAHASFSARCSCSLFTSSLRMSVAWLGDPMAAARIYLIDKGLVSSQGPARAIAPLPSPAHDGYGRPAQQRRRRRLLRPPRSAAGMAGEEADGAAAAAAAPALNRLPQVSG